MASFLQGLFIGAGGELAASAKEKRLAREAQKSEALEFDKEQKALRTNAEFKFNLEQKSKEEKQRNEIERTNATNDVVLGLSDGTLTQNEASAITGKFGIDIGEVNKKMQSVQDTKIEDFRTFSNDEKSKLGIPLSSLVQENTKTGKITISQLGGGSSTVKEAVTPEGNIVFATPQEILEKGLVPKTAVETELLGPQGTLKVSASNAISRQVASAFGGQIDPTTGTFSILDPNKALKVPLVSSRAEQLLLQGKAQSVAQAVEAALAEELVTTVQPQGTKLTPETIERFRKTQERLAAPKIEDAATPTITTKEEFDALPSGAVYISNGKKFRKP